MKNYIVNGRQYCETSLYSALEVTIPALEAENERLKAQFEEAKVLNAKFHEALKATNSADLSPFTDNEDNLIYNLCECERVSEGEEIDDQTCSWIRPAVYRVKENFDKLKAKLALAEAVCESIESIEWNYHDTWNVNEAALDAWRKSKEGK